MRLRWSWVEIVAPDSESIIKEGPPNYDSREC